jgi:hypothetical protein
MARVANPQPGSTYKVIAVVGKTPRQEVVFKFVNVVNGGQYEVAVNGQTLEVGNFSDVVRPRSGEVHSYP